MKARKVLIDLIKLRDLKNCKTDAYDSSLLGNGALKSIRELATFRYSCRRCEDAPCIKVCPANALEKDENGSINRALNLCIRCRSCVCACPFGTIMNDLFEPEKAGYKFYNLSDEDDIQKFVNDFPDEVVSVVEMEEDPENHVYPLGNKVLIKDQAWEDI